MAKKFLKNLKSLFIIEEEIAPPPPPVKKNTPPQKRKTPPSPDPLSPNKIVKQESPVSKAPVPPPPPPPPKKNEGKVNEKFVDLLLGAMQKNNLDGLDYLEFKESLETLSKMPMDEATRYKSAYAVVKAMGTNVHKLIQTANHYIDILNKEKEAFNGDVLEKMKGKLEDEKKVISLLQKSIKDKRKQIQQLTKDIDNVQRQIIDKTAEIDRYGEEFISIEKDFSVTFKLIKSKIDTDIENMRAYLTVKSTNDPHDDSLDLNFD